MIRFPGDIAIGTTLTPSSGTELHSTTYLNRNDSSRTTWYEIQLAAGGTYSLASASATQCRVSYLALYGLSSTDLARIKGLNNASDRNLSQELRIQLASGGNSAQDWSETENWIKNVYIENVIFDHVHITLGTYSSSTNCRGVEKITFKNCKFLGCTPRAFTIGLARDVLFEDCEFDTVFHPGVGGSDGIAVYISRAKNIVFRRCRFIDCSADGIQIQHPDSVWTNTDPEQGFLADLSNFHTFLASSEKNRFTLNVENIVIEDCEFIISPYEVFRKKFITQYLARVAASDETLILNRSIMLNWGENGIDIKQCCGPILVRRCLFDGYHHVDENAAYGRTGGKAIGIIVHGYAQNVTVEDCDFRCYEGVRFLTRRPASSAQHFYTNKCSLRNCAFRHSWSSIQLGSFSANGRNNGLRNMTVQGNYSKIEYPVRSEIIPHPAQVQHHHRFSTLSDPTIFGYGLRDTVVRDNFWIGGVVRRDPDSEDAQPAHSTYSLLSNYLVNTTFDSQHETLAQETIQVDPNNFAVRPAFGLIFISNYSESQKQKIQFALDSVGYRSVVLECPAGLIGAALRNYLLTKCSRGVIVFYDDIYAGGLDHAAWTLARWSLPDWIVVFCGLSDVGLLSTGLDWQSQILPAGTVEAWDFGTATAPRHEVFTTGGQPCEYTLPSTVPNTVPARLAVSSSESITFNSARKVETRFGNYIPTFAGQVLWDAQSDVAYGYSRWSKPFHRVEGINRYLSHQYWYSLFLPPVRRDENLTGLLFLFDGLAQLGLSFESRFYHWEYRYPLYDNSNYSRADVAEKEYRTVHALLNSYSVQPIYTLSMGGRDRGAQAHYVLCSSHANSDALHDLLLNAPLRYGVGDLTTVSNQHYPIWQSNTQTYYEIAFDNVESWRIAYLDHLSEMSAMGFNVNRIHYSPEGTASTQIASALDHGCVALIESDSNVQHFGSIRVQARRSIPYELTGVPARFNSYFEWQAYVSDAICHAWLVYAQVPSLAGYACHSVEMSEINTESNPLIFMQNQSGRIGQLVNGILSMI